MTLNVFHFALGDSNIKFRTTSKFGVSISPKSLFWEHLYMEMQKRLRMEAVEKTTSMAWYMSHSHTENSQCPSRRTFMALNTIAPTDTERSETNDWVK